MKKKNLIPWASGAALAGGYLFAIAPRVHKRPAPMKKVYYAHRGLHDNDSEAPENTMAAFQKAVDAGYGMELDVQLTKDGQVVVIHDMDLKRLCQVDAEVDSFTYEQLQQFSICASSQRIPLFRDVLRLVDGRAPLIVELKYKKGSRICEKAQEILQEYRGEYCIESFYPGVLLWYKKHYPEICRGQLSMNYQRDDGRKNAVYYIMRFLLTNFITRPDFIAYDCRAMRALSKNLCRRLFGCPSVAWTVKSQEQLDSCRGYYDYFIFEGFLPQDRAKERQDHA